MFKITGQRIYAQKIEKLYKEISPITPWTADEFESDISQTLLYFSRLRGVPSRFKSIIRSDYQNTLTGDNGVMHDVTGKNHAYGTPMSSYFWGSNSTKSQRGLVFAHAAMANMKGASQTEYKNAASHYLHYIHGTNPLGLVYLSKCSDMALRNPSASFTIIGLPMAAKIMTAT